jgi:hypothetical protein
LSGRGRPGILARPRKYPRSRPRRRPPATRVPGVLCPVSDPAIPRRRPARDCVQPRPHRWQAGREYLRMARVFPAARLPAGVLTSGPHAVCPLTGWPVPPRLRAHTPTPAAGGADRLLPSYAL